MHYLLLYYIPMVYISLCSFHSYTTYATRIGLYKTLGLTEVLGRKAMSVWMKTRQHKAVPTLIPAWRRCCNVNPQGCTCRRDTAIHTAPLPPGRCFQLIHQAVAAARLQPLLDLSQPQLGWKLIQLPLSGSSPGAPISQ